MVRKSLSLFESQLLAPAVAESFRKLAPAVQVRNPVMFVVYIGSILTTILFIQALRGQGEASPWFMVLFANFAEALAEGRSRAQAASLRGLKQSVSAKKLRSGKLAQDWV